MSSKTSIGRHRAANVSTNPLTAVSKAVASNAGSFGRQAAVVVVATGLVTSLGLPAEAADTGRASAENASSSLKIAAQTVTAAADATVVFDRPATSSTPKPAISTRTAVQSDRVATTTATAEKPVATEAADVQAGAGFAAVVAYALSGKGKPYVWGGTTPNGRDCSGFTGWAYAQAGISLPRTNQWNVMKQTSTPQPGDLVVQNGGSHVAIYLGNGMEIGALNPSQGTLITSVAEVGSSVFYTLR